MVLCLSHCAMYIMCVCLWITHFAMYICVGVLPICCNAYYMYIGGGLFCNLYLCWVLPLLQCMMFNMHTHVILRLQHICVLYDSGYGVYGVLGLYLCLSPTHDIQIECITDSPLGFLNVSICYSIFRFINSTTQLLIHFWWNSILNVSSSNSKLMKNKLCFPIKLLFFFNKNNKQNNL